MTTPAAPGWPYRLDPVTAEVACSGEDHRVTWRRGKLVLEDHDLDAEETMVAFGGEVCPCLRVMRLWREAHSWAMSVELYRGMRARLGPDRLLAPGPLAAVHELCLARSWERAWRRSGYHSDHGRLLADVVTSRATAAVREHLGAWRQQVGCRMISKVDVALLRPGQAPFLRGSMDTVRATAAAAVGVRWLLEVWARGLAVVDGAFVLEAGGVADAVRAVRWVPDDRGWVPAVAAARAVRDPEAGWRLTWDDV